VHCSSHTVRECIKGTVPARTNQHSTHNSALSLLQPSNVAHNNQRLFCEISGLHSGFVAGSGRCDTTPLNTNLGKHSHISAALNIRRLSSNSINR